MRLRQEVRLLRLCGILHLVDFIDDKVGGEDLVVSTLPESIPILVGLDVVDGEGETIDEVLVQVDMELLLNSASTCSLVLSISLLPLLGLVSR